MIGVLVSIVVVAASLIFAFRQNLAGQPLFWAAIVVPYLGLAAFALKKMWDDGTLVDKLKPRSGDLALGAVTGLILVGASWAARTLLTPSTPRQAWFYRLYMQLGDPEQLQRSLLYTLLILLSALCEEIVWRGMVLSELKERFGARR